MRKVFVNPVKCIGCRQCEIACATAHSASLEPTIAFLEVPTPRARIHVDPGPIPTLSYPTNCRHCNPAPCVQICPSGAMHRAGDDVVLMDAGRCIGCAMCAVVCPFDAITFHPLADSPGAEVAVAVKCDLCIQRLDVGLIPACVEVCKVGALTFGDVNEVVSQSRRAWAGEAFSEATEQLDPRVAWRAGGAAMAAVGQLATQQSMAQ